MRVEGGRWRVIRGRGLRCGQEVKVLMCECNVHVQCKYNVHVLVYVHVQYIYQSTCT